jgi:RNA polymerase sigma-70 factor, ECF subfamily
MFVRPGSGSSFQDWDDQQLSGAFRDTGDNRYFQVLFTRYAHLVYGQCLRLLPDRITCQDLTLEIFHRLAKKLRLEPIADLPNYLFVAARNAAADRTDSLQREQAEKEKWINFENSDPSFVENEAISRLLIEGQAETDRWLEAAIEALVEDQRRCIRMFFFERLSYRAIAEAAGFDEKYVKSCLQNGKRSLRIALQKRNQESEKNP